VHDDTFENYQPSLLRINSMTKCKVINYLVLKMAFRGLDSCSGLYVLITNMECVVSVERTITDVTGAHR